MGLDEALMETVSRGKSPPVLRLYGWKPPAVSVGYFQDLREEVDLEACRNRGIDVVRRITGGGAVFHQAELTYSLIMPLDHPLARGSIGDSYALLCAGIIAGLSQWALEGVFAPINDVLVGGKKISGSAQTRREGVLLQHGTVLLDIDGELMFSLLRVPPEKVRGGRITGLTERVTSLKTLLGREVPLEEAAQALAEGFRAALSLDFDPLSPEPPRPQEEERAFTLGTEKFASAAWLFRP
jgi:lipoate-protein ligase A